MNTQPTEESFLKDVQTHQMRVLRDDGIYRHLRCSRPGSGDQAFEILTWPGYLAFVGDMGSYVFSRVDDMFRFFRREREGEDRLPINPGYWAEKVRAEDVQSKVKAFSIEVFRQRVRDYVEGFLDLSPGEKIPTAVNDDLEPVWDAEDEHDAVESIRNFDSQHLEFVDFWESPVDDFSFHYIWCCMAIVWAIGAYDKSKAGSPA